MDTPLISQSCHVRKPANPKSKTSSKYSKIWRNLESKLTAYHVRKHEELIGSVLQFFSSGLETQNEENVPTATVRLGSNVSDHAGVFDELTSQLAKITPFICRLTAIDCGSLPAIIQKLFTEFVSALDLEDEPKFKRALVNVENLVQLYKLVTQEDPPVSGSPRKRKSTKYPRLGKKKFVIIIEDVASVKTNILEDLCQILKSRLAELETCLVFGISSTAQYIHKTLSLRCASCLLIRTFSSPPVSETLNGIFDLLVSNRDFPFKLEPELFHWMSEFVLYHDFSLTTMLHILRVALTLHLDSMDPDTMEAICKPGTDEAIDEAIAINNENDSVREELAKALNALTGMRTLLFKDIYLSLQKKSFIDGLIFRKTEQMVRFLSAEELRKRLQDHLEQFEDGKLSDSFRELRERLSRDDLDENLLEDTSEETKTFKSRSEWLGRMSEVARKKRTTKLDLVRDDLIRILKDEIRSLKTLEDLPKAKDIYIGNVSKLRAMFAPELRTCLHQALSTPASILHCKCCRVKPNETSAALPALSTAYKLHLECGKMINVYDWLQSYQAVREDTTEVSIAEFLRALRELQVLGYVKPTTRKMDHVQRLTWGSC